jgi:hypothetical protein
MLKSYNIIFKKKLIRGHLNKNVKGTWDRFHIIIQALIAFIAIIFTILFNFKQKENSEATLKLASSNLEIAKSQANISKEQLKSALIPFLASEEPKRRAMAMYLAKVLDEDFASTIATLYSINDPNPDVRKSARITLGNLSNSSQKDIKLRAEKSIAQYDIANELRSKGFLKELNDAVGYLEVGNILDKEKALQIYRKIVGNLTITARNKLDQTILNGAELDYHKGFLDNAVNKYRVLFSNYSQPTSY